MSEPRWSGWALLLVAILLVAAPPAQAGELLYSLEVPDGLPITYTVDLPIEHPGELIIDAEWSGSRVLSFRIDTPEGTRKPVRRSGPSPQHLSVTFEPDEIKTDGTWTLSIKALAARGPAEGRMTIVLPEPTPVVTEPAAALSGAPSSEPKRSVPLPPSGSPSSWKAFAQATEHLRHSLESEPAPDACRWQQTYLDYLEKMREELYKSGTAPTESTQRVLSELAGAIRMVDNLRQSTDPEVIGPVPQDSKLKRDWVRIRRERFRPIEAALDDIQLKLRRGHAPDLESEEWPVKMVSCLMACERHFDQRVVYGAEEAVNYKLAQHQWQRLLTAAGTLEATASLD
jgi:hypothetical protein